MEFNLIKLVFMSIYSVRIYKKLFYFQSKKVGCKPQGLVEMNFFKKKLKISIKCFQGLDHYS